MDTIKCTNINKETNELPIYSPGMSERAETDHDHSDLVDSVPASHRDHHDHSDNVDMRDLVTDTEHLQVSGHRWR